ncbi:MAG: bifunctional serine/threonine-protein kinase/formylglycine-generating enzyme family protein, partial [Polyangiales bacterium]
LQEFVRVTDDTLRNAHGSPLFKAIVGHYLRHLRELGVLPQSQHEEIGVTLERVRALESSWSPASNPNSSRDGGARAYGPTIRELSPRPERDTAPPERASVVGPNPTGAHRLIVLEEPAHGEALVAVKSNFRVEPKPIGEGGAAIVYRARDIDTGLRVALKIVTIPDPSKRALFLGMFQNEREIQGGIDSETVVRIYKTGLTGDGQPYIVMELLTGGSLADHIEAVHDGDKKFQLDEAMHIGAMAIAAVAAAHRAGVLHRDVKPDNFLFSERGRALKLGDFGISQRKEKAGTDISGTVGYIPPESFESVRDTEARDVFALGVTLYLLFTGSLPFSDESPGAAYQDVKARTPAAPSEVRPDRQIPSAVDRVVRRALARDRDARYADADEMLFEFLTAEARAKIDDSAIGLRDSSTDARHPDHPRRKRLWMLAVREVLRSLERLEDEFPSDRIRAYRLELAAALHEEADRTGDERLVRETAERVRELDPRHPRLDDALSTVRATLSFDDPSALLKTARAVYTVMEQASQEGIFELRALDKSRRLVRAFEFERGRVLSVGAEGEGVASVLVPLPVRPGQWDVRVPIYPADAAPEGSVVVTAGSVPARSRHGAYAEAQLDVDVRRVDHDFAIGNLVSHREYLEFLRECATLEGPEVARRRTPAGWRDLDDEPRDHDGEPIDLEQPVRGVRYGDVLAYLAWFDEHQPTGRTGERFGTIRLPTLNELKRTCRGNDARAFPWGDAIAIKPSMSAFQYIGFPIASAPMACVPADALLGDRSPFSVPADRRSFKRAVYHLVGNVAELVSVGVGPADRAPLIGGFPVARGEDPADATMNRRFFVSFGVPFNHPAPTTADVISLHRAQLAD